MTENPQFAAHRMLCGIQSFIYRNQATWPTQDRETRQTERTEDTKDTNKHGKNCTTTHQYKMLRKLK